MTSWARRFAATVAAVTALAPAVVAQNPTRDLEAGIEAYRTLDYEAARTLLQRALRGRGRAALTPDARATAYVYLGAAEHFRLDPGAAARAFDSALAANPRHRPDTLLFPPDVTAAFEFVRRETRYVAIAAPSDTVIDPARDAWVARLVVSAPHEVEVRVAHDDSDRARILFAGAVADSVDVKWDGRLAGETVPAGGAMTLVVSSKPAGRGPARELRTPVVVDVLRPEALPVPAWPDSLNRSTGAIGAPGTTLAVGLLTGAATLLLPSVVSSDGGGGAERYVVGGALSVAGVVGFLAGRRADEARVARQREIDRIRRENLRRQRDVDVRIHTRVPRAVEGAP